MKTKVFTVFSALAAVTIAAPQHHQTSLNKAAQSPATTFQDPCWPVCLPRIPQCPDGWYSNNKGSASYPCWTCCKAPENTAETPSTYFTPDKEEIDIYIKISDTSAAKSASSIFEDYCWPACWHSIPRCPRGWYSNNKGTAAHPCWTCCRAPRDVNTSAPSEEEIEVDVQISDTTPAVSSSSIFRDICWKICAPEKIKCPDGWHSKHFGHCWTCCRTYNEVDVSTPSGEDMEADMEFEMEAEMETEMETEIEAEMEADVEADMEAEMQASDLTAVCRKRRYPRRPRCPRGWHPVRRGRSWRCCRDYAAPSIDSAPDKKDIKIDVQIDTTTASPASLFEDPCWRVCWHRIPKCPRGWYSNNKGTAAHPCWTCCKAPADNAATSNLLGLPTDL